MGLGLSVVHLLVLLVDNGVLGCLCASTDAGVGVFGDVLVGLLGARVGTALDGLRDVVCGVLRNEVSKVLSVFRIEIFFTLTVSMMNFEELGYSLIDCVELFVMIKIALPVGHTDISMPMAQFTAKPKARSNLFLATTALIRGSHIIQA